MVKEDDLPARREREKLLLSSQKEGNPTIQKLLPGHANGDQESLQQLGADGSRLCPTPQERQPQHEAASDQD
jgi:hypothetical protein